MPNSSSSQMTVTGSDKGKQRARTLRSLSPQPSGSASTAMDSASPPSSPQRGDLAELFSSLVLSGRGFAFRLDVRGEEIGYAIESDEDVEESSSSRQRAPRGRSATPAPSPSSSAATVPVPTPTPVAAPAAIATPPTPALAPGPVGALPFVPRAANHPGQLAGFRAVQNE
jgi:hypothetical protein